MTGRGIMPPGRAHFCDLIEGVDDDRGEQTKGSVALYTPNHKQNREAAARWRQQDRYPLAQS